MFAGRSPVLSKYTKNCRKRRKNSHFGFVSLPLCRVLRQLPDEAIPIASMGGAQVPCRTMQPVSGAVSPKFMMPRAFRRRLVRRRIPEPLRSIQSPYNTGNRGGVNCVMTNRPLKNTLRWQLFGSLFQKVRLCTLRENSMMSRERIFPHQGIHSRIPVTGLAARHASNSA